jgi:hypothetical protein
VKVYTSVFGENFPIVNAANSDEFGKIMRLGQGRRVEGSWANVWVPMRVMLDVGEPKPRPRSEHADVLHYSYGGLVVTDRGRDALEAIVRDDGEFLPLDCDIERFWFLHTTRVIDAIDLGKSTTRPVGHMTDLTSFAFKEDLLRGVSRFALPLVGWVTPSHFVTDQFVDVVESNKLLGTDFRLRWDSERPTEPSVAAAPAVAQPAPLRYPAPALTPLDVAAADQLERAVQGGAAFLGVTAAADSRVVVSAIDDYLGNLGSATVPRLVAEELGALLGAQYEIRFGWHWTYLTGPGGRRRMAIVDAAATVGIVPVEWIGWILSGQIDVNVRLSFNMVAAGQAPSGPPGNPTLIN